MSILQAVKGLPRRIASATKTSFAVIGVAATLSGVAYAHQIGLIGKGGAKSKNRVLLLPLDRLKLVKRNDRSFFLRFLEPELLDEIELEELVDLIHEAAADATIVSLFCQLNSCCCFRGAADVEEIRNALKIFRESHRIHKEPNFSYRPVPKANSSCRPRPLYAYADSFESTSNPENPDYFLASMCTHLHLQRQGSLRLSGFSQTVGFYKKFLEKYGAKVHVFKHGPFKNAPNSLTETGLTKAHRKNVETYLFALNNYWLGDIAKARKGLKVSGQGWNLIQNSGSFSALAAKKMGLVDYTPEKNPLDALLEFGKCRDDEDKMNSLRAKWGRQTDLEKFKADELVTLSKYGKIVAQRRFVENNSWKPMQGLREAAEKYPVIGNLLALAGFPEPYFRLKEDHLSQATVSSTPEKIALIKINGTIDGKKVRKIMPWLRKIKDDTTIKCVVVRISSPGGTLEASEKLLVEFKDLPQKVVFSFGNVSASGGYYVAAFADHIFASKCTITGSIGVFGVRLDLSGSAAQYGVKFGRVTSSDFALSNNVFSPCTKQEAQNASRNVDRAYKRFKEVVSEGRGLGEDYLETIAGGRVWTGEQAIEAGLVDEVGGLSRAIAYARRNFTSGDARVVHFMEDKPYFDRFRELLLAVFSVGLHRNQFFGMDNAMRATNPLAVLSDLVDEQVTHPRVQPKASGLFVTVDENTAIQSLWGQDSNERPPAVHNRCTFPF